MPHRAFASSKALLAGLVALVATSCATTPSPHPMPAPQVEAPALDEGRPAPRARRVRLEQVLEAGSQADLQRFGSSKALAEYLASLSGPARRSEASGDLAPPMPSSPSSAAEAPAMEAEASGPADDAITNTQEAGVDEGGIVKAHGDHLLVLRRGRLFSVAVGDGPLRPISYLDVSPSRGHQAWYDEMLVSGNTVVVIGYSYEVGATELDLFEIDGRGHLTRRDTYFLRSNDYYSSRNYASRLIGESLVFYMPYALQTGWGDGGPTLPGVAGWRDAGGVQRWVDVIRPQDIYRPVQPTPSPVLHTVVSCDLRRGRFECEAQGILGPYGRSFYVSRDAVYVWVHGGGDTGGGAGLDAPAVVYRLPLQGRAAELGALRVWGAPVDQFSFQEDRRGFLNVLVRSESEGDGMWGPERSAGDTAMLRVPTEAFARGVSTVSPAAYVDLPEPSGRGGGAFVNRFVGDHLLYGAGQGYGDARDAVFAFPVGYDEADAHAIDLPHGVERIEPMGEDAVVIGGDGRDLHFSALELSRRARLGGAYVQRDASQGEVRSHGFFYQPVSAREGLLGLPIRHASESMHGSAEVLFLEVDDLDFAKLGALASSARSASNDRCETSCVDWYGNARPIFYRGRIFALLGYELVEGDLRGRDLREVDRVDLLTLLGRTGGRRPIWKD